MKAVLLDDADDTTSADLETSLAELLGDDVDRGVRIEEAVTDDLAHKFVGTDVIAFGAGPALVPSFLLPIEFEQLKYRCLLRSNFFSGLGGTEPFALAFNEQ